MDLKQNYHVFKAYDLESIDIPLVSMLTGITHIYLNRHNNPQLGLSIHTSDGNVYSFRLAIQLNENGNTLIAYASGLNDFSSRIVINIIQHFIPNVLLEKEAVNISAVEITLLSVR